MTRLERYKNILIPVDDVAYAEYRKPDKGAWDKGESSKGTFVRLRNGYVYDTIQISKSNVLDDFKKWYDETMARIGSKGESREWGMYAAPLYYPWQIVQTAPESDGGVDVLSPTRCYTSTKSNGETVVSVFNGHSSAAPSYVKRDGTSRMMIQHDG